MAIALPETPFLWGANGSMKTPEQVAREREIAAALLQGGMDYSPVDHWLQGAARAAQGLAGGLKSRWADDAENTGRQGFQSQWDSVFGGGQTASIDPVAQALIGEGGLPASTAAGAASTMPPPQTALGATNQVASTSNGDWFEYANQGATRNQPLAPELLNAMSFLPSMGVSMRVVSGGQDAKGPNRVGSTRHDHGNAGDVDFYSNGRKLDWNNPEDLPILSDIVAQARANGVTGIGAGDDYMGAGRFHIGFGNEAVWGAGGKSENAPEWLRAAYNGTPMRSATQVAQAGGMASPDIASLLGLASDPWANDTQRSIIQSLLGQQIQQQDPSYQLDLQLKQAQLAAANAPAGPEYGFTFAPDGTLIRTDKTSGSFDPMGQFAPEPEPGFSLLSPEEAAASGLDPAKAWQVGPDNRIYEVGGSGVNVTTNVAGGNKFDEAFATQDAAALSDISSAGIAAQRNLGRIDQLSSLLEQAPNGFGALMAQRAGEFGIETEGLDTIQAAQAIINSLVPEQRQPGSGPMSDADLELFKQSLPRIINTPQGNRTIIDTMRAIAEYDAQGAEIVRRLRAGEIDRSSAFDQLQSRANPLQALSGQIGASSAQPAAAAPNQSQPPRFNSQADFDAAPSGTVFTAPDGSIRVKP